MRRLDYIAHHGIKGMKWYLRRFQNKDGSLTPEGRERYGVGEARSVSGNKYLTDDGRLTDEGMKLAEEIAAGGRLIRGKVSDKQASELGIDKGQEYDTIKKGAELTRLAGEGDIIDDRRKYVSITPWDNDFYESEFEMLPIEGVPHQFKYETIKDLKVASPDKVVDAVLEKYGSTKVSDIGKDTLGLYQGYDVDSLMSKYGNLTMNDLKDTADLDAKILNATLMTGGSPSTKWLSDRSTFLNNAYTTFMHQKLIGYDEHEAEAKEVYNSLKKQGFDAIIDYEDWSSGDTQYPLILVDPKSSIRQKSKTRLFG